MKSAKQIFHYVLETIGQIYHRPLMYGGTAQGVDTLLHQYHALWAFITDQHKEFMNQQIQYHIDQDCGSANFSTHYSREHPDASEQEIAAYVVKHWKILSKKLGLPIPYEQIERKHRDLETTDRSTDD